MRAYDIIHKKREGQSLSKEEIDFLIQRYTAGELPDYQMAAWAMAVFFQGMDSRETADLTMAMVQSGEQVDLSLISGKKVDKHSTGGVGDTTTLVLAPLVSAAGVPVAKMSGRGLGHTGGTIDKLEAIPGFKTSLSPEEFIKNVNEIGVAVVGQSGNLTPADKKLYALRDVTATVDSIPLIASSIMSKKIAGGAEGIVLDVKTGEGAFMKEVDQARELARAMVEIGQKVGRKTIAVITDMNQPLGYAVGNALEVKEAIATLKGEGPEDLTELSLTLGANMLILADRVRDFAEGYQLLEEILSSGQGLEQLKRLIQAQSGDPRVVDNPTLLPKAEYLVEVKSQVAGYIQGIKAEEVGLVAMLVGAGRNTKEEQIDPAVGVVLQKKIAEQVAEGETLATIHLNDLKTEKEAVERLRKAFLISKEKVAKPKLIYEIIK